MKSKLCRFIPAGALWCLLFYSCKKNDTDLSLPVSSLPAATQSELLAANNAIINGGSEQNEEVADIVGATLNTSADSTSCRQVSFNPSRWVYPHLKTVDFGSGCTGPDGIIRMGKKLITIYANWKTATAGTLISETTFSDFYVDSVGVSGNVQVYLDSTNTTGDMAFKIVANKTFTDSKGNTTTFISTNYWKQIAGDSTTTNTDNVYQVTGSASGTEVLDGATAVTWTSQIDAGNPVIKMGNCYYRSKGGLQIKLTLAQGTVFNEYLDYGNGTCDNEATLSINGGTPQQITLPMNFWPLSL